MFKSFNIKNANLIITDTDFFLEHKLESMYTYIDIFDLFKSIYVNNNLIKNFALLYLFVKTDANNSINYRLILLVNYLYKIHISNQVFDLVNKLEILL